MMKELDEAPQCLAPVRDGIFQHRIDLGKGRIEAFRLEQLVVPEPSGTAALTRNYAVARSFEKISAAFISECHHGPEPGGPIGSVAHPFQQQRSVSSWVGGFTREPGRADTRISTARPERASLISSIFPGLPLAISNE